MKRINITHLVAAATAAYCIVKMVLSITSNHRSVKAIVRRGGEIVAQGTPEQVAAEPRSFTGRYLAPMLDKAREREAAE